MTDPVMIVGILGVDDDEDTLMLMKEFFDEYGVRNYQLFTSKQELMANLNENVWIVIIDHFLGGVETGLDLLDEIREFDRRMKRIVATKVIAISGNEDPNMLIEYELRGAMYLWKGMEGFWKILAHRVKTFQVKLSRRVRFNRKQIATMTKLRASVEEIKTILKPDADDDSTVHRDR